MKLVLFDIDGTILKSRGVGRSAVKEALELVCQSELPDSSVSFAGRTDPEIMRDLLLTNGLAPAHADELLEECLRTYITVLMRRLRPEMITVLPGIRKLLSLLRDREDVALGLLTGNLKETAYLKLHAAGLGSNFPFGAFGSDRADRYHLPEIAANRAFDQTGVFFDAANTIIIGDTPNDIGCANSFGAVSVGVCTGSYTRHELESCGARLLMDDLSDVAPVMELLGPEEPID